MISLNIDIINPWSKRFTNLWCKFYDTPFEHKFIELEVYRSSSIVTIGFNYTTRRDHAGLDICIGLLTYNLHFNFYDNRHWNQGKNSWDFF